MLTECRNCGCIADQQPEYYNRWPSHILQEGWACPKCGRVYAPHVNECWLCNQPVETALPCGPSPLDRFLCTVANANGKQRSPTTLKPQGALDKEQNCGECEEEGPPQCPYCDGYESVRAYFKANDKVEWFCRDCGHYFDRPYDPKATNST